MFSRYLTAIESRNQNCSKEAHGKLHRERDVFKVSLDLDNVLKRHFCTSSLTQYGEIVSTTISYRTARALNAHKSSIFCEEDSQQSCL